MHEPLVDHGVLFVVSGRKHLNVLVVAIWSLRRHWQGPIHVAVGDEHAEPVVRLIAKDKRLDGLYGDITWKRWQPPTGNHGDGYRQKTFMDGLTIFGSTIFLDADTLVRGSIEPLFTPKPYGVTLTQFADWKSNGRKISGRIEGWKDVAAGDVAKMQAEPLPAINTGVLSWRWGDEAEAFFREWKELTAKKPVFINDELAAQLIFHRHAVRVLDSRWNCSPIHDRRKDGVVLHFHGKKHVNREQGRAIWLPAYDQCVRENIAGIADWTATEIDGDRRLRQYLDGRDGAGTLNGDEDEETVPFVEEDSLR